jgi:hypothetical protein
MANPESWKLNTSRQSKTDYSAHPVIETPPTEVRVFYLEFKDESNRRIGERIGSSQKLMSEIRTTFV